MAVHITIYPEEGTAAALRQFMAERSCSATVAVELLLEEHNEVVGREHRSSLCESADGARTARRSVARGPATYDLWLANGVGSGEPG